MEKSGLLISPRNINPIPFTTIKGFKKVGYTCNNFNFRNYRLVCSPFPARSVLSTKCSALSPTTIIDPSNIKLPLSDQAHETSQFLKIIDIPDIINRFILMDLDPATAKLAISLLGPFLSAFGFLFVLRIVMSWYPKLPVEKFPYVIAYAPTEPILGPTRKVIPPLAGVDVTPVVWFGLISFLSEILVGPQGLLVLLSQKV